MRLRWPIAWLLALLVFMSSVSANPLERELARVLRLDEVASILREEGLAYGSDLETDMLAGRGGQYFRDQLDGLYDADAMSEAMQRALVQTLDAAQMQAVIAYFDTQSGQRILSLENSGRVAMADPAVEEVARSTYQDLAGSDDPHLAEVARFVSINDLIERNVSSALDSNYHFFRGLVDGGGARMAEDEILSEVWAQEDEVRSNTTGWIYGFLLMAYQPLSRDEMQSYSDFSATAAGQALNRALFEGFDQIFNEISYGLGLAVAQAMNSSDI